MTNDLAIYGLDFSSKPSAKKPIVVAKGLITDNVLALTQIELLTTLRDFEQFLLRDGPWVTGFDFPFSFPRDLIMHQHWPNTWPALMQYIRQYSRDQLKAIFKVWCDARPAGAKFAHRTIDRPAGASPSMKWVNPPVAWMLLEGGPRLLDAGISLPGICTGDTNRVGLEAYPGFLARQVTRESYKSDDVSKQTTARLQARTKILHTLVEGTLLGLQLDAREFETQVLTDGSGDKLDAVMCCLQAAWGWLRRHENYGLPSTMDPLEGWIVSVPALPSTGQH
ncbi:DUF429 domain-containing protein [Chitinivorax sp. B]|uniref:DUF429 domain-containing protein n=1 Tax=Chitinivorax sp. B TaxID=2502235 RepID=UPI0010F875AD|nr:DUF429 domain-containing protein [Chitinivorax sp. B]